MPDSGAALRRATAATVWLLPVVFLLWLYREAVSTWFMAHSPGTIRWHYRQVVNALVYQAIVD